MYFKFYQLANTLIFILSYTSRAPEHFQRIRQEFDGDNNFITIQQIENAHYTKACLHETFRVCPTAFCLARILEKDTKLSGYDLKRGVSENRYTRNIYISKCTQKKKII